MSDKPKKKIFRYDGKLGYFVDSLTQEQAAFCASMLAWELESGIKAIENTTLEELIEDFWFYWKEREEQETESCERIEKEAEEACAALWKRLGVSQ